MKAVEPAVQKKRVERKDHLERRKGIKGMILPLRSPVNQRALKNLKKLKRPLMSPWKMQLKRQF